jgi:hypothetical protein
MRTWLRRLAGLPVFFSDPAVNRADRRGYWTEFASILLHTQQERECAREILCE